MVSCAATTTRPVKARGIVWPSLLEKMRRILEAGRPRGRLEEESSSNCGGRGREEEKVGCCCRYGERGLWKEVGYQSRPLCATATVPFAIAVALWFVGGDVSTVFVYSLGDVCALCTRWWSGGIQMRRANANETGLCGAMQVGVVTVVSVRFSFVGFS
jgi:hypothetical protein